MAGAVPFPCSSRSGGALPLHQCHGPKVNETEAKHPFSRTAPALSIASPHPAARDVLLFLHIPKAAGSTLQWPLDMEYARSELPDVADCNLWRGILYYPGPQWGFFKPRQLETPPSVVAALQNHPVRAVL